jgi:hypothetical protein
LLAAIALAIPQSNSAAYTGHGPDAKTTHGPSGGLEALIGVPITRTVMPASLLAALEALHTNVPAYSRQTGLACSACHYAFPQLTPFGRQFKMNGYTLTGEPTIVQQGDSNGGSSLKLPSFPGLAAMVVSSMTQTSGAVPGAQNGTAAFPQQFSLFLAGAVTQTIGVFTQFTYTSTDGSFGIDNFDIRYANHRRLADRDLVYGLTLHNNPTVQDFWNTVPAWSYPFMSSASTPASIASTLVDGALAQQVVGLGAYSLYDNLLYTEATVYRSAPQGAAAPLDSSATNAVHNVIPYWRVALQHETPSTSLMIGTFGLDAHIFPTGVSGLMNHYTDAAIDGQAEFRQGTGAWIGRASYIHERQQLAASAAAGKATAADQSLSTARLSVSYLPNLRYGVTLGYFQTSGTSDTTLYGAQSIVGSRTGSPNTSGIIGELSFNPWQNTRLGLQYVAYDRFNGASTAYDVPGGRNASQNNTLYGFLWFAF